MLSCFQKYDHALAYRSKPYSAPGAWNLTHFLVFLVAVSGCITAPLAKPECIIASVQRVRLVPSGYIRGVILERSMYRGPSVDESQTSCAAPVSKLRYPL